MLGGGGSSYLKENTGFIRLESVDAPMIGATRCGCPTGCANLFLPFVESGGCPPRKGKHEVHQTGVRRCLGGRCNQEWLSIRLC